MAVGIALLVCIVGGFVCIVSAHPKVSELGRLAFGIGLFVVLLGSDQVVAFLAR